MEAYNTNIYPVFEADQVLSQKDLNNVVSHLEEQDRITRKNLTGLGIVCGLELSYPTESSVKISCGTAITSLGFQINWEEKLFNHYHEYELSDQFLKPDYTREPHLNAIFKHSAKYEPIKKCFELLTPEAAADDKIVLTKEFLNDKLIVLLLEVTLIDQKNCVTTNCDDKGKRMEFNIRPLLIPLEGNEELMAKYNPHTYYTKLSFPRYNVPYKEIITGSAVLDQFRKAYDPSYLVNISNAIAYAYNDFKDAFQTEINLPALQNCKTQIENTVNSYKTSINIQYLWDWISDIVHAYNEIADYKEVNPSVCCVNEGLFPFHVVLGGRGEEFGAYRTPFTATLNTSKKEQSKLKKLSILFERLAYIINSFSIERNVPIKITPSLYGNTPLSDKAIPYYYSSIPHLNTKWNPALTLKQQNDTIMSYHAYKGEYTGKEEIKTPLLFDIEPYNFFRVEGHIGKNYKTALKEITLIKDSNGLPFKITALNAVDFVNREVDITKFDGRWDDLETDYDLARKRLYNITEFVINWMDQRKNQLAQQNIISVQNIDNFKNILLQIKNLLTNDLKEFLPNFKSFYEIFKELNYVFLFHRWCIQLGRENLTVLAEDLIDRLDDINELFLEDPFTVIYEEAYTRWKKLYKDLFFSTFIKKHPGIEHKAGVTKGGTFVLVYVDTSIFRAVAPPLLHANILATLKAYKTNINIESSIKQELEKSVKFVDYTSQLKTKPKMTSVTKCEDEADNIKANLLELAKYNLEATHTMEMSTFILENLKSVLEFDFRAVPQGTNYQQMVIADFFLPYACCGEGNTLEIKFEVNEPLSISLETLKFCNNDTNSYEIKLKGKFGGTFTGTGKDAVIQRSDKYFLQSGHSSLRQPKTYTLQYETDGEQSNVLEFEIFSPTGLKWTAERGTTNSSTFIFINLAENDTHEYEIDFGDGSEKTVTKEYKVEHTFSFNEKQTQFNVTIKQLGEVCENSQIITVTSMGDFNSPDFDSKDFYTGK